MIHLACLALIAGVVWITAETGFWPFLLFSYPGIEWLAKSANKNGFDLDALWGWAALFVVGSFVFTAIF